MKRRSRPLNIVMALILAVALIPGGEITVYASGTAEEIISEIPDETVGEIPEENNEWITEETVDEIPEESIEWIPDVTVDETAEENTDEIPDESVEEITDETAPEDEEGFGEALFYVEIKYYRPYKTATYELEYYEEDGHLTICGYRGVAGGKPVIPARINDVPVTIISESAFKDCSGFTGKLVIPEGVELINNNAFKDCSGLESISFPASLVDGVSASVTEGCSGLREVINNSDHVCWLNVGDFSWIDKATGEPLQTTYDGSSAKLLNGTAVTDGGYCKPYADASYKLKYRISGEQVSIIGCTGKKYGKLVIPEKIGGRCVTAIGDYVFKGGGFRGGLTIPAGVTAIGMSAFEGCGNLTGNLTIPDNVTTIEGSAFKDCSGFTGKLTIGKSATEIPDSAFFGCSGLTGSLTIPGNVTSIGDYAFSDCSGLTGSLTIPGGVTTIGAFAFRNCSGFTGTLTIPSGVTNLGNNTIENCRFEEIVNNSAQSLTLPNREGSIRYIDSDSLERIYSVSGQKAILNTYRPGQNTSYELTYEARGDGIKLTGYSGDAKGKLILPGIIGGKPVTAIGADAFKDCNRFTGSLTIPKSVDTIGLSAFDGCSGLTGDLTIPAGVTVIEQNVFNGCSGFTGKLTIPVGVTSIAENAFSNCSGLTGDLTIPAGVTYIGESAFNNCRGFTGTLEIPESVTFCGITATVFDGCGFHKVVNDSDCIVSLYSGAGYSLVWVAEDTGEIISEIQKGTAVCEAGYYKPYKDAAYELEYQILGDYVRIIGYRGKDTGDLMIPDKISNIPVTEIGVESLQSTGFNRIRSLGDNVTTIRSEAFWDMPYLTGTLIIPDSVENIEDMAFLGCKGLTGDLTVPDSVISIGKHAFAYCEGLTGTLTIGKGVTYIGEEAFESTRFGKIVNNSDLNVYFPNTSRCRWVKEETGEAVTYGGKGTYVCTIGSFKPASGVSYELVYSVMGDGTVAIIGCTGRKKGKLVIPDQIEGKKVSKIGKRAFEECSGFTGSLTIPEGVSIIEERAFFYCGGFTGELTIPESVTSIGNSAFSRCSGFTGELTIPENVTSIGDFAFDKCSGFTGDLTIPGNVTSIGEQAFSGCSGFTGDLTISSGVKKVGKFAFAHCTGFTGDATVPSGVTSIGEDAFAGCTGLSRVINNSGQRIDLTAVGRAGMEWYDDSNDVKINYNTFARATAIRLSTRGRTCRPENAPYELYYWKNGEGIGAYEGVYITGVRGDRKENLTIPEKIGDMDVVGLGKGLFTDCSDWTGTLEIPESVQVISQDEPLDPGFGRIINHSGAGLKLSVADDHSWNDADTGEALIAGEGGFVTLENGEAIRSDAYGPSGSYSLTHTVIEPQVYTGKAVKPDMKVYFGKTLLKAKTDYTVKYEKNVNTGEAAFTITGKGRYTGKTTDTFTIVPADIANGKVNVSKIPSVTFSDKDYTPVPVAKFGSKKLTAGKDFSITYHTSREAAEEKTSAVMPKEPGGYYARIEGIGNFTGYRVIENPFIIMEAGVKHVDKLTVGKIRDQAYTGEDISLDALNLTVKDKNKPLAIGEDYTAVCEGKEAGKGTVTITGMGAYTGTRTVSFNITGISMKKVSVTLPGAVGYTGVAILPEEVRPQISLSYKANKKAAPVNLQWKTQEEYDAITEPDEKQQIKCIVSFSNNINAGKATVTLAGINGYTGTVKKTFKITPLDSDSVSVYFDAPEAGYQKGGVKPKPIVQRGIDILKEGKDYTLSYSNNKSLYLGGGKKKPTVTVRLKGNYKGKKSVTFFIVPADLGSRDFEVVALNVVYRNKANNWKTKVTVRDERNGSVLKEGKDYSVRYSTDAHKYVPVKARVEVNGCVYAFITGKGCYEGETTAGYNVVEKSNDISGLKAVIEPKEYTGSGISISPSDITWMQGKREVYVAPTDITIESYKNNIKPGTATVTVRGSDNMAGTKKIRFKIRKRGFRWWWER